MFATSLAATETSTLSCAAGHDGQSSGSSRARSGSRGLLSSAILDATHRPSRPQGRSTRQFAVSNVACCSRSLANRYAASAGMDSAGGAGETTPVLGLAGGDGAAPQAAVAAEAISAAATPRTRVGAL